MKTNCQKAKSIKKNIFEILQIFGVILLFHLLILVLLRVMAGPEGTGVSCNNIPEYNETEEYHESCMMGCFAGVTYDGEKFHTIDPEEGFSDDMIINCDAFCSVYIDQNYNGGCLE